MEHGGKTMLNDMMVRMPKLMLTLPEGTPMHLKSTKSERVVAMCQILTRQDNNSNDQLPFSCTSHPHHLPSVSHGRTLQLSKPLQSNRDVRCVAHTRTNKWQNSLSFTFKSGNRGS